MIRSLLGAVQFLTIIPVRAKTASPGRSAIFFPLIGAWLGIMGAAVFDLLGRLFPQSIAAALSVAFWVLITGALHEDGLADVADAFRAHRSPGKILEVLKDSRIGAQGAAALVVVLLLRWQAVSATAIDPVQGFAVALGLSRASMVGLAWVARPAGAGLGADFSTELSTTVTLGVIAQAAALAVWAGVPQALGVGAVIVLLARRYFERRLGGVTGDCLGATAQIVETAVLLLLSCRPCIS
jgi:adenosylcobinamide-GDP ribazoletransferase